MTARETERLARLEEQVNTLVESNKKQTEVIEAIQKTLNELTGGKQDLMWITGIFIALVGLVIAFLGAN